MQPLVRPEQSPSSRPSLETGRSIVIIDTALADYQSLFAGVTPSYEVYLVNANQCGVAQITEMLRQQSGIAQLHLLSHGSAGELLLGKSVLSLETLPAHAVQLQTWRSALSQSAEILLYGCEVAQGDRGQQFVQQLSKLTGASIAAASTKIGNSSLGGTWTLDTVIGTVTGSLASQPIAIEAYAGILSSNPVQYNLNPSTQSAFPRHLINVDGTLYFTASPDGDEFSWERELWKLDPTTDRLVRIELEPGVYSFSPTHFARINSTVYFAATNSTNGREIWKIDPAIDAPVRLTDIEPGTGSSSPTNLTNVNGTLYLVATNSATGRELWKLDPTTGASERLTDIEPGAGNSSPSDLTNVNGTLYFVATNSASGRELWKLDPSSGTPVRLTEIEPGAASSDLFNLTNVNGTLYFIAVDRRSERHLWKVDPVTGSPVRVESASGGSIAGVRNLTNVNGTLYFVARQGIGGNELWKVDPTTGDPVQVDFEPRVSSSSLEHLTNVNGTLYFFSISSASGQGLWKIDPVTGNPARVELAPGSFISSSPRMTNVNGTLYFNVISANGNELWRIDPATGNPMRVNVELGANIFLPQPLTTVNGTLYTVATNRDIGQELWRLDLTTGNQSLIDINTHGVGSSPANLININGTLYFAATDAATGRELWRIDPTTGNPIRITDIEPGPAGSFPANFVNINGTLYFSANRLDPSSGANRRELWRVDPATGNPIRVEVHPGVGISRPRVNLGWEVDFFLPENSINVNGTLYFRANSSVTGQELWRINATTGNVELLDIEPGATGSSPHSFVNVNGTLYFIARSRANREELWKINPATGNPVLIEIEPGTDSSSPSSFGNINGLIGNINGTLYFAAYNKASELELWKLDPTTDTPVRLTRIDPRGDGSSFHTLINVNGTDYLSVSNNAGGRELWKFDLTTGNAARIETASGAVLSSPQEITNVNGTLYLIANRGELWKLDPTTGNPSLIGATDGYNLTNVNGTLYFVVNGNELWRVHPTTGNLERLEIEAFGGTPSFSNFTNVNGTLYFSAFNRANGNELWRVDPTTGDLVRLEIELGVDGSSPHSLTNVNGTLYFSAYTRANGRSLWRINPSTNQPERVIDFNPGADNSDLFVLGFENGRLYLSAGSRTDGAELWTLDLSRTIDSLNAAPTIVAPIANQIAAEDAAFRFTISTNSFADPDPGDRLTYTATLADGRVLPDWLRFDAVTRTLSGTASNENVGTISVRITATDRAGDAVSNTFNLTVTNTNDAPVLTKAIPDQVAAVETLFSLTLPSDTFNDTDAIDALTLSATLANGSPLPAWLRFDAATRTLSGTPPQGSAGRLNLRIIAIDQASELVSDEFELVITDNHSDRNGSTSGSEASGNNGTGSNPGSGGSNPGGSSGGIPGTDFNRRDQAQADRSPVQPLPQTFVGTPQSDRLEGSEAADILLGQAGNDMLLGNGGDDHLVGGTGRDILSGGAGADRFVYNVGSLAKQQRNSILPNLERLIDLNPTEGDRIVLNFDANPSSVEQPRGLFNAGHQRGRRLENAIQSAFQDKNQRQRGKQKLEANEAVFLTWKRRTFLAINDSVRSRNSAGVNFSPHRDLVIDVTGISSIATGTLNVETYFA